MLCKVFPEKECAFIKFIGCFMNKMRPCDIFRQKKNKTKGNTLNAK